MGLAAIILLSTARKGAPDVERHWSLRPPPTNGVFAIHDKNLGSRIPDGACNDPAGRQAFPSVCQLCTRKDTCSGMLNRPRIRSPVPRSFGYMTTSTRFFKNLSTEKRLVRQNSDAIHPGRLTSLDSMTITRTQYLFWKMPFDHRPYRDYLNRINLPFPDWDKSRVGAPT